MPDTLHGLGEAAELFQALTPEERNERLGQRPENQEITKGD